MTDEITTASPLPHADQIPAIFSAALAQIDFARRYTLELLDATPADRWFEIPAGMPASIAWQVGHLTVSQYGLLMFRIRGRQPDDLDLIPGRFRKAYGRGSLPQATADGQPTADELIDRMQQVHRRAMAELHQLAGSDGLTELLLQPVDMPYVAYPIKLGAVLLCPLHEHLHAGQIGSTRRALRLDSVR